MPGALRPRPRIAALLWLLVAAGLVLGALRLPAGPAAAMTLFAPAAFFVLGLLAPAMGHHHGRRHARQLLADDRRARRRLGLADLPESSADRVIRTVRAVSWGLLVWGLWFVGGAAVLGLVWWVIVAAGPLPG